MITKILQMHKNVCTALSPLLGILSADFFLIFTHLRKRLMEFEVSAKKRGATNSPALLIPAFIVLLMTLPFLLHAEGTKQLSPTINDKVNLNLNSTGYNSFGRYDGVDNQRLYIHIANPTTEQVFLGFSQPRLNVNYPCAVGDVNAYFRIKDASGTVVYPTAGSPNGQLISPLVSGWANAVAGPNQIVGSGGYNAVAFDPAGLQAGDYYVEFSRTQGAYNSTAFAIEWWDITVATKGGSPTAINGRVFAKNWAFYTPSINCAGGAFGCATPNQFGAYDRAFNGAFHVYTAADSLVTKVDFNNAGFQPIAFNIFFNDRGPGNTGNIVMDRKSVNNALTGTAQYPLFLNDPDMTVYPSGSIGTYSNSPFLISCDGQTAKIAVSVTKPGQIEAVIDLDVASGGYKYDPGTRDVALALKVVPLPGELPPYVRFVQWNGKDGLGNQVDLSQALNFSVNYVQGIFHLPVYDAEFFASGFTFNTVRPMPPPAANPVKLYYDDSNIPDDNLNGSAKVQLDGCTAPCHTWNNGCYGDANTINTWFFGSEERRLKNERAICVVDGVNDTATVIVPSVNVYVLNNDWGVSLDSNSLSTTGLIQPLHGSISVDVANRLIQYMPVLGYNGLDSFQYRICDSMNFSCDTAWVILTVNCCAADFQFAGNCLAAQLTGTFIANGIAGQTGTLTVPITGATFGSATFNVTGTGFTGTLSTTLAVAQDSVTIPITYNGTGVSGSRTLTVTAAGGTGSCTPSVSVAEPVATFTFNCGSATALGTLRADGTVGQTDTLTISLTNTTIGTATFSVTGTGFTGTLSTTLAAAQATVAIPIIYDGTGVAGNRTLTVTSPQGTGACTPSVSVALPPCIVASVGGTAAYAGSTLCDASNIGTAMLTGQTGDIVRWETSTNSGSTWSPLAFTTTSYNFANAANGQQYRAIVSNGAGCLNEPSAVATIATSAAACTSASCDNFSGNIIFTAPLTPTLAGYNSKIIMTNASGAIQYTSANNALTINGVAVGNYLVYRVVYDTTQLPLPVLTVGTNITAIGGACAKFTNQLAYKVCPPPDVTTAVGQPLTPLRAGVSSNIPITVANIGTGSADGTITTTITIPSGVTAPATFTNNGWTCSTTAPSVVCTNPTAIAGGANSVFNVPLTPTFGSIDSLISITATTTPVTEEIVTNNNSSLTMISPPVLGVPDVVTAIGQPTSNLEVGQPSNLPITVANIGTGSAIGTITTTITLPTGVSAPATFTNNGWTCSTTAPSVVCTNPTTIVKSTNSIFNVPVTPNASLSGTTPTFIASTTPVTAETITNNNAATTTVLIPVVGGSLLSIRVLLQGNYDPSTGLMHDSLRKKGVIPLSDPYRTAAYSAKFTHRKNVTTQTTTNGILAVTGSNAIIDWVFVEVHDATNPATVIATKSALLQRDGDVVSAEDGTSPVYIDSIRSGNYFISIRHRNHLGVMTATTRSLSATSTVVDFTVMTAAQLWNKANGDGYETTQAGIRNLLWAGDTDGNRQTVFAGPTNDVDPVFFDAMTNVGNINFVPNYILNNQYQASDVNLDGQVIYQSANNEVDIILFMVFSHTLNTGFIPSFIITEQLP